jgi:uncharacterized protein (UPF0332 family)
MEKRALREAECWLICAKRSLDVNELEERFAVAVAQAIHALIRANDALTLKYLRKRAARHEHAITLFQELIRQNKIPSDESRTGDVLIRAVHQKSGYEYKGEYASKADAEKWIYEAEKFLTMVKKYVR